MKLYYQVYGEGEALVLTAGMAASSDDWKDYVSPLSRHNRVLTWDHRGHGQSGKSADPEQYSQALAVRDLKSMVEAAGGSADHPAVLIGHSMGGYLSLRVALEQPDLVKALVLIATGPGFKDIDARNRWNETLLSQRLGGEYPEHVTRLGMQEDSLVIEKINQIDVPALVIVGDGDRPFLKAKDFLSKNLRYAVCKVIGSAGHNVHKTCPEETLTAIQRFLTMNMQGL